VRSTKVRTKEKNGRNATGRWKKLSRDCEELNERNKKTDKIRRDVFLSERTGNSHPSLPFLILVACTCPAARTSSGKYGHSSPRAAQKAGCF